MSWLISGVELFIGRGEQHNSETTDLKQTWLWALAKLQENKAFQVFFFELLCDLFCWTIIIRLLFVKHNVAIYWLAKRRKRIKSADLSAGCVVLGPWGCHMFPGHRQKWQQLQWPAHTSASRLGCAQKFSQSNQIVRPDAPVEQQRRWELRRRAPTTSTSTWRIKRDVSKEKIRSNRNFLSSRIYGAADPMRWC